MEPSSQAEAAAGGGQDAVVVQAVERAEKRRDTEAITELQKAVVLRGIGPVRAGGQDHISLRGRAWKVLLGVGELDCDHYLELVRRGEHERWGPKIRNDTFRTFKNCEAFQDRVPEARLVRVLNAFVHACASNNFTYVQGMNVVCGMLLFVMPELDAFNCFLSLVRDHVPAYMGKNLEGVTAGCQLVEECIQVLDPELARYMAQDLNAHARIYAFAPVMTLSACCPPIDAIVRLWDVYFAAGVHLNVIVYASQLVLMRDEIMGYKHGAVNVNQCLRGRDFPPVDAQRLLGVVFPFLLKIDASFMDRLVRHTRQASPAAC